METDVIPEMVVETIQVAGNVDQVPEVALEEAKAEAEDHFGQAQTYLLYIGNLNPKYSSEELCSMLKDILSMASVTLQRYDIEVIKKRKQAYAFVQVATEISLEQVLKQLLLASEAEHNLSKELVQKGKNLVVGQGKKPASATKNSKEVRWQKTNSSDILGIAHSGEKAGKRLYVKVLRIYKSFYATLRRKKSRTTPAAPARAFLYLKYLYKRPFKISSERYLISGCILEAG